MHVLVDQRVVEATVDEIDEGVGEHEEEGELKPVVVWIWFVGKSIVEFGVAPDFREEEGSREESNPWHSVHSLADLHLYLVLEEFGVLEGCFIEDENVGQ